MQKQLSIILLFAFGLSANGQSIPPQKEPITYLDDNHDFPHLDEDYNLHISSEKFDSLRQAYAAYLPDRELTYRDSLDLVLALKHQGYTRGYRVEMLKATYSWERVGFYLYIDEPEAKELRKKINIKTPYDVVAYFQDSTKTSPVKDHYLERLKKLCLEKTNDSTAYYLNSSAELLRYAFKIDAAERLKAEHKRRGIKPHTH